MTQMQMSTTVPTITTARLVLRPLTPEDAEPLHRIMGDRDVMRYFPNPEPPALDRVQRLVAAQIEHWAEHGYGWWAVEPRGNGEFIGWSGLQFLPETDEIEVAYLLDRPYWGQGLATESAQAGLGYGLEDLELETIVAIVHPENAASRRVIEKLGMSFVDRTHYFGMDVLRYRMERASFVGTRSPRPYQEAS